MTDPEETPPDALDGSPLCGACRGPLPPARYVYARAALIEVLCSADCHRRVARRHRRGRWATRYRQARRAAATAILVGAFLAPHAPLGHRLAARPVSPPRPHPPSRPALPPGWYGPDWPPTETETLAALGEDTWIHPLSGPARRMPRADSRVFGAARPGQRPIECRNGHCGVDLGGEIWGEQVHAVHDGVVDFVQRNANPDRGGEFVRLSHRDGTVFTQYFHLAAIRRGIERGAHVKAGEVIGLLGDTGVKESAPHLHFAISVRPSPEGPERYIDPEPLIALWAVRVPVDGGQVGLVTTLAPPGLPLGSASLSARRRKAARLARHGHPPGAETAAAAPADEPAAGDGAGPADDSDAESPGAGETDGDSGNAAAPSGDE
jgi:murein DD-endopeptidase MepM/ murein hydrolase activator NlpD